MPSPASRNAPCPCGSGRRYKLCHGAIGASPLLASAPAGTHQALMEQALALQQRGNAAQAIRCYESVLAADPGNFDALHMLGVALFQRGQFERALDRIHAALAVRDDVPAAHSNFALVQAAIAKRRQTERELAPEILPRFRPLCAEPAAPAHLVAAGEAVHVVVTRPNVDAVTAERVAAVIGALGVTPALWVGAKTNVDDSVAAGLAVPLTRIDVAALTYPRSGTLVFVGMESSAGAWLEHCRPARLALLCDEYLPGALIDRLRELSDEGRRQVALWYADATLGRRLRLPGTVLAPRTSADTSP